jgi:hypothetical protein
MSTDSNSRLAVGKWWFKALRWAGILPAFVGAYIVATWAYFFGLAWALPTLSRTLRYSTTFEGSYVLGPLIVFGWFFIATAGATIAGIRTAPAGRVIVAFLLGALIVAFLVLGGIGLGIASSQHTIATQQVVRLAVQAVGHLSGFAVATIAVLANDNHSSQFRLGMANKRVQPTCEDARG